MQNTSSVKYAVKTEIRVLSSSISKSHTFFTYFTTVRKSGKSSTVKNFKWLSSVCSNILGIECNICTGDSQILIWDLKGFVPCISKNSLWKFSGYPFHLWINMNHAVLQKSLLALLPILQFNP